MPNLLLQGNLEDPEENTMVILRWILGQQVEWMGGGFNWFRIVPNRVLL